MLDEAFPSNRMKEYFDKTVRTTPTSDGQTAPQKAKPRVRLQEQDLPQHYYAVQRVMGTKMQQGRRMYELKWKDCYQITWEPAENLQKDRLHAYHKTHTKTGTQRRAHDERIQTSSIIFTQ